MSPSTSSTTARNDASVTATMRHMGIGLEHIEARLEHFPHDVRDRVTKALTDKRGLLISGLPGRGKTYLAAAILRYVIENHSQWGTIFYQHEGDIVFSLRESFREYRTEMPVINDITGRGIVIIDDLGLSELNPWEVPVIDTIFDRRYRDRKTTVATSNFDLAKLAVRLGDRVASRLAGMCEIIVLGGPDRRLLKRE